MVTLRHLSILFAVFLFNLAARAEGLPADAVADPPIWAVSGTTISVQPSGAFERGHLQVVGPRGYQAEKSFAGGGVTLDLLVEGRIAPDKRGRSADGGPAPEEQAELTDPSEREALSQLPDGVYRFELVLGGPGGTSLIHHLARASGGSLDSGAATFAQPSVAPISSAEASGPTPAAVMGTFAELVEILDENDSGITGLDLQANNDGGTLLEEWRLENRDGDLRIVEKNDGSADLPRVTVLQDKSRGQVGIGTTAPVHALHISSETAAAPRIRIEDRHDGVVNFWDLRVVNGVGVFANAFSILDSSGNRNLVIFEGAPNLALTIDANGVEVGTDFSVLSSRDAKKDLTEVDPVELLARLEHLPIFEWEYREASGARHLGPTAEDFRGIFALGASDRALSPTDLGGVALAAIQGLQKELELERALNRERMAAKSRQIEALRTERTRLEERLEKLEQTVEGLAKAEDRDLVVRPESSEAG